MRSPRDSRTQVHRYNLAVLTCCYSRDCSFADLLGLLAEYGTDVRIRALSHLALHVTLLTHPKEMLPTATTGSHGV